MSNYYNESPVETEVEAVLNGFVRLNAKQQAQCLNALAKTRHGDKVERAIGDEAANEQFVEEEIHSKDEHYNKIF